MKTQKKNTRKRVRNQLKWKVNERKMLHQSGKAYVSRRGKMVSAKKVPGCSKCPHKCNTTITRNERCVIFKSFYSLAQNEKKQFILQQTERVICARKINKDKAGPSRRDFTF